METAERSLFERIKDYEDKEQQRQNEIKALAKRLQEDVDRFFDNLDIEEMRKRGME